MALVEVHRELATVRNGAKDMVRKFKRLEKKEKYTQGQLAEAQTRITDLEEQLQARRRNPTQTATTPLQDEVN